MKVAAGHPIGVAVASHNHLTVWYGPHLPRLVITCCHCYVLSWMDRNPKEETYLAPTFPILNNR
jgi:hypothetical protein